MDHAEAWPRGPTPRPRSGAQLRVPGCDHAGAARRSYPRPRPGAVAERSNPTSKERWQRGHRRAERSYSKFKVRRGGGEEIPLPKVRSRSCTLLEQP